MARRHVFVFIALIGIIAVVLTVSCGNLPALTVAQSGGGPAGSVAAGATGAPAATAPAGATAPALLTRRAGTPVRGAGIEESSTAYYVSPGGSDSNPGTEALPFATVDHAREVIRSAIASGMTHDITVFIRGGEYYLSSTVSFDKDDSGRDGYEVIYRNYPGELPTLIGGQQVTGWEHYSGSIYRADVGTGWVFYVLMENGVMSTMAREPNAGKLSVEAQVTEACQGCGGEFTFQYAAGDLPTGFDYSQAQVVEWIGGVTPPGSEFWVEVLPIKNINWGQRQITVDKHVTWYPIQEDDRYFVRGAMEFLDAPGEWFLDQATGYLYYWPMNTPIADQIVVAPRVTEILKLLGDSVTTGHVKNIKFQGLKLTLGDLGPRNSLHPPTKDEEEQEHALIYVRNAENIVVTCCTIENAPWDGVAFKEHVQNSEVSSCEMQNIGRSGVSMVGLWESDIRYVNKNNTIHNNYFHDGGIEQPSSGKFWIADARYHKSAAIALYRSGDNEITHNEVVHWPNMGIAMMGLSWRGVDDEITPCPGCWDYLHSKNNSFQYNDVSYVLEDSNDGGGIFLHNGGKYNVIDHNLVYDIASGCPGYRNTHGIYIDDDTSWATVSNNIVYEIGGNPGKPITIKGMYNTIHNNIIVDNTNMFDNPNTELDMYFIPARATAPGVEYGHISVTRNIFYRSGGDLIYYWRFWEYGGNKPVEGVDYNLFYHPGGNYRVRTLSTTYSLAQWQALDGSAYDQNSIVADPLFADRLNHDYTLLPGSPAFALGFENIDQESIGREPSSCEPIPSPTSTVAPTLMLTATSTATPMPTATPTTTPTPRTVISYYLPLISLVPGIDGDLGEWGALPAVVLDADTADHGHYWREVPDSVNAGAILRSGWDEDFLYFAIEVRDDVLVADSADIWQDDGIELGIDGLYDHISSWFDDDHQFTLTFDGRVTDFGKPTDAVIAVTSTLSGGWALEVAIAAEGLGAGPLTVGKVMGFTFGLHDDDDGGDWESYLVWEGSSTNDSSAEYGALVLSRVTPTPIPTPPIVTSYFLPAVPDVNGDLSEWGTLPAVVLDVSTADWVDPREVPDTADASAILRSGWDDEFLYFAVEIRDDVLVADSADIWQDDGIELGIDGLYDHISSWFDDDHQFTLTFDGRVTDFGRPTDAVIAVTSTLDGGWALEVAIAAEGLGAGPLTVGKVMGFTFGLHDDDDGGDWESYLIWEGHSTNDSSAEYGRLLLKLSPASLGGFAWNDTDADREQDGTENGISGVTLVLCDVMNDLVESTVTDANGFYRFEELSPGIYTVMATKPPGYRFTTAATVVRSVASGDQYLMAGFGFVATTAVTLVSFGAEVWPEGVVVSWRTLGEQGITGFHLRRALSQFGPWLDVTDGPIPAQGMSGVMATYRVVDDEAEPGLTYYYRLVTTPSGQAFGPIRVET